MARPLRETCLRTGAGARGAGAAVNENSVAALLPTGPRCKTAGMDDSGELDELASTRRRRRVASFDDQSLEFRSIRGTGKRPIVIFLPWHVPLEKAKKYRLLPHDYIAAYEMPSGIISSTPEICVESIKAIEREFDGLGAVDPTIIGLSIGNFPATYLANKHRLRLISFASGARGEWLTFNSPAATHIRARAQKRGHSIEQFEKVLKGWNPVDNLKTIGAGSKFVFGAFDTYVPRQSQMTLIEALRRDSPQSAIYHVPLGHRATIFGWRFMAPFLI